MVRRARAAGGAAGGAAGAAGGAAGGSTAGASGKDAGTDTSNRVCTVKINEVQTGGATALDEFVELYNTCPDKPLDLTGYSLVYRAAAGTTDFVRVSFTRRWVREGQAVLRLREQWLCRARRRALHRRPG